MTGRHRVETAAALLALLVAWEVAGRYALVAGGALPAPSQILTRFWADREDYALHVGVTLHAALLGFGDGDFSHDGSPLKWLAAGGLGVVSA